MGLSREKIIARRIVVVVLSVMAAALMRLALEPVLGVNTPFLFMFGAVTLSAWYGGLWTGLGAVVFSALVANYYFMVPSHSFHIMKSDDMVKLGMFMLVSSIICAFAGQVDWAMKKMRREIEQRKRTEEDLRLAKDLAEAANQAKSEFLANMSHEIRTPMNAIVGLASLLGNENASAQQRKEFVRTIQHSSLALMELINDLLDITKMESAELQLEHIPFNLPELVEEIISIMAVKAKEKQIELAVKFSGTKQDHFIGDPLRLRQVMMNLMGNAVKFTPRGAVTMQIDRQPTDQPDRQLVTIEVVDTGIGIAPSKLGTIFSKFSQADTTITRKYGGTGLGLSICKTLVDLMGGTISVVSTEGLGSKFIVTLPLDTSAEAVTRTRVVKKMEQSAPRPGDEAAPLVLLVEDYKANILVATATIENCGYRWELAENGELAVEKVKTGNYAAILMDVQMPQMDGLTATKLIRVWEKSHRKPPTPILGVTAYSLEGDRERCLQAGMDDYLSKPFQPTDLKEKLRMMIIEKKAA